MYIIYDFLLLIYALIYLPYLLLTKRWFAGYGMRFGSFSPQIVNQIKQKANIWVHAVSVGEVMVIDGFIDHLRKEYPAYQVIATVTTKTGYDLARERLKDKALVIPSPVDFSFVARRFVSLIKPKIYIAVETEIWPNLYRQLYRNEIPFAVINGRISDRSWGRYKAIRLLLKMILNQASIWCMQSQRDADRIMDLGADTSRVVVTGNVKFDDLPKPLDSSADQLIVGEGEFWWVAGSTHPGEEEIVLDVFRKVIKDDPRWRLIIAPRHIDRVPPIMELINHRGFKKVKLTEILGSKNKALEKDTIIVVDTIGQLRSLYAKASLVFVGKTLCVGGGHNIIEPAFYGKAIVIGPKFENFRDVVSCFKEGNGLVQVEDVRSFEIAIRALCSDASERKTLGNAARQVIADNQGATKRSLDRLAVLFK